MIPVFPLVAAAFALLLFLEEPQNALFVGCELHEYLTSVNLVILAKTVWFFAKTKPQLIQSSALGGWCSVDRSYPKSSIELD